MLCRWTLASTLLFAHLQFMSSHHPAAWPPSCLWRLRTENKKKKKGAAVLTCYLLSDLHVERSVKQTLPDRFPTPLKNTFWSPHDAEWRSEQNTDGFSLAHSWDKQRNQLKMIISREVKRLEETVPSLGTQWLRLQHVCDSNDCDLMSHFWSVYFWRWLTQTDLKPAFIDVFGFDF